LESSLSLRVISVEQRIKMGNMAKVCCDKAYFAAVFFVPNTTEFIST
jgi:hypothetical protein